MATTGGVLARHGASFVRRKRQGEANAPTAANEARRAFEPLGPTYVKLAQLIASSPGLFPDVLADEFRACLDMVPPISPAEVTAVLTEELGAPPQEVFARFDPEPLASASIAQVHTARLPDGEEVVVKIQRPGIRDRVEGDLRILMRLALVLHRTSAKGRMANPVAVVEDFAATLAEELNFVNEARAMERFGANLRAYGSNDNVRVPSVRWPFTTPRVLTMERIHGYKIDDLAVLNETGWDLESALKRGVRAWMEAALEHGFFHGDVHAGNLMLDTDGNIVFLDFGIVGRLDDKTKEISGVTVKSFGTADHNNVPSSIIPIQIQVNEIDDGADPDDNVVITGQWGREDLWLYFDTRTGQVFGDETVPANTTFKVIAPGGLENRGAIKLRITGK
jgi:predicted unusual protein kinase regulating ubiquinone biosynthesis (AarF/ABC1/UbiB family)